MRIPDREVVIVLSLLVVLLGTFWFGSRYPALLAHAEVAETELTQGLSFGVVVQRNDEDPLYRRAFASTINWVNTNKKGMSFGICLGATILTLFRFLPTHFGGGGFMNALKGLILGVPLGVCANCATPISKGLFVAGGRVETAVTTMMSSPTLNVVVLSILFSLFPVEIALLKVGATLFLLLVVVPGMSKVWERDRLRNEEPSLACSVSQKACFLTPANEVASNWQGAFTNVLKQFMENLRFLILRTVPLMLLAGALGAVLVEAVPLKNLLGLPGNASWILGVALLGTLLPVPMTFDVIVASSLYQAGLAPGLTMALLFTMGIFSIYPMMVFWREVSKQAALTMTVLVIVTGLALGVTAEFLDFSAPKRKQLIQEEYPMEVIPQEAIEVIEFILDRF